MLLLFVSAGRLRSPYMQKEKKKVTSPHALQVWRIILMVTQKDVLDIWWTSFWKIPETTDSETEGRDGERENGEKAEKR